MTRRLFVGLALSPSTQKYLTRIVEPWHTYPLLFTRPANLHLTLLFLGFRREEDIPELCTALEAVAQETQAFELYFEEIGLFPSVIDPHFLWLAGNTNRDLLSLVNTLSAKLEPFSAPKHTYRPHVTLARVKKSAWRKLSSPPLIEKHVRLMESIGALTLFESTVDAGRRVYLPLADFSLAA